MERFFKFWRTFSALVSFVLILLIFVRFIPPIFGLLRSGAIGTALAALFVFVIMPSILAVAVYFILVIPAAYLIARLFSKEKRSAP